MFVVDASDVVKGLIEGVENRVLTVTGTSTGGYWLVSVGTFLTRMRISNSGTLQKGSKFKVHPETLAVTVV